MTTLATANLNFDREESDQVRQVTDLRSRAEIVLTQEDIRGGRVNHRERIWCDPRVQVERSGSMLSVLDRRGQRIGMRRFRWRDVDLPGLGDVRVVVVHMPPLRMRGALYAAYAWRLRMLLRNTRRPWVVGGDWNWLVSRDPAKLEKKFGAKFFGPRIDGWAVHPELLPHVKGVELIHYPHRQDNHPAVLLNLRGRVRI